MHLRLLVLLLFMFSTQVVAEQNYPFGLSFVEIPAGEFLMGNADLEEALIEGPDTTNYQIDDELPQHNVRISAFSLMPVEVTQEQWFAVMGTKPGPEKLWQKPGWQDYPVVSVNWHMTQRFIDTLNKQDSQHQYRLPTEAQWEYAARAGSSELRPFPADDTEDYAWFIHNSGDEAHPVGTRRPNKFGLYDMIGNVWEWVDDWYAPDTYAKHSRVDGLTDPAGPEQGRMKVRRGGSYHCPFHLTRTGYRAADKPWARFSVIGFRLVAERVSSRN